MHRRRGGRNVLRCCPLSLTTPLQPLAEPRQSGRLSGQIRLWDLDARSELHAPMDSSELLPQPVLFGARPGHDVPVHISSMSDGTCDQLYLALRIATLEHWFEKQRAAPFYRR